MIKIHIDYGDVKGKIRKMHAVNNAPIYEGDDQSNGNFHSYKAARIPFARNHDASFCSDYVQSRNNDVLYIFRNFDADENDPDSYDFYYTDRYIKTLEEAGTKIFYRLGHAIEHEPKKLGTLPPKDFLKWAKICEHIIRHYTEGWADGFHYDIPYWEIWNEPDLDADDAKNKRTWGGTKAQFFEMYEVVAKYLKEKFPHLKIGGPALAGDFGWADDFFAYMKERNVPIDFFSWHCYNDKPIRVVQGEEKVRAVLKKYGYENVESICNEWNYNCGWAYEDFHNSVRRMHNIVGGAYAATVMNISQASTTDMLMYYDARPKTVFNGMFDFYLFDLLPAYFAVYHWADLYELGEECRCEVSGNSEAEDAILSGVRATAAKDGNGRFGLYISSYTKEAKDEKTRLVSLKLDGVKNGVATLYRTDKKHEKDETKKIRIVGGRAVFFIPAGAVYYLSI